MMEWYFEEDDHVMALELALARWFGTPFIQHQATPGVGVDCVRFVREVYRDCGVDVAPADKIPRYSLHSGHQAEISQILGWLKEDKAARKRLVPTDEDPMPGDLVLLRQARVHHHLGIVDSSTLWVWHVGYSAGVCRVSMDGARDNLHLIRYRLRA